MSFYLGADSAGDNILHITKGVDTQANLQSGVISSTVFHSSLPYITYTSYDAVSYTDYYRNGWYSTTSVKFPSEAVSDIISGNKLYIVVIDGNVLNSCDFYLAQIPAGSKIPIGVSVGTWYASDSYVTGNQIYYDDYSYSPRIGYEYKKLQGAGKRNVKLIVVNVNIDGTGIPPAFTNSAIYMSSSGLIVKGIDILNYAYISPVKLNNIDATFSNGTATFQLINQVKGTSLQLTTLGSIVIKIDGKEIFNTDTSDSRVFFDSSSKYTSGVGIADYSEMGAFGYPREYRLASSQTFDENEHFLMGVGLGDGYYSRTVFGSSLLTFTTGQLFVMGVFQTGPSTYTQYALAGYNGRLYVTNEIVRASNPPFNTGPRHFTVNVTKLKTGGV